VLQLKCVASTKCVTLDSVCCSVLQCVAVEVCCIHEVCYSRFSVLQCVAVCCSVLQLKCVASTKRVALDSQSSSTVGWLRSVGSINR